MKVNWMAWTSTLTVSTTALKEQRENPMVSADCSNTLQSDLDTCHKIFEKSFPQLIDFYNPERGVYPLEVYDDTQSHHNMCSVLHI